MSPLFHLAIPRSRAALFNAFLALLFGLLAANAQAADAEAAGRVASARGQVIARAADDTTRALSQGAPVYVNDRITTGARASVQLAFTDTTRVSLGENAEMKIDDYRTADADSSILMSLSKGVFRVVTGLVGKSRPQAVKFNVPVGTIGIRGTHFGGAAAESSAVVILLDPEDSGAGAIEVSNTFGAVVIDRPGFGTEIADAQSPPSPPRRMRLRAIDNLIRSLSVLPRR